MPAKVVRERRAGALRLSDAEKSVPRTLNEAELANDEEETTVRVAEIFRILKEGLKSRSPPRVCFFDFVLNPDSFGQTVENIFYLSFLAGAACGRRAVDFAQVKDGRVHVSLSDELSWLSLCLAVLASDSRACSNP